MPQICMRMSKHSGWRVGIKLCVCGGGKRGGLAAYAALSWPLLSGLLERCQQRRASGRHAAGGSEGGGEVLKWMKVEGGGVHFRAGFCLTERKRFLWPCA